MAGHLKRHPLERTFDDVQRSVTRLERFIEMYGSMMNEIDVIKYEKSIKNLEQVLSFIPKQYRKTYREWANDQDHE